MLNLTRQEQTLLFSLVAIFGLGMGLLILKRVGGIDLLHFDKKPKQVEVKSERREILVFIKGQVENPGVFHVALGTRVTEAIEQAHPKEDADLFSLPLAEFVKDGETLVVPQIVSSQEKMAHSEVSTSSPSSGLKVNIRTADEAALNELPGIGPALASRIIDYRTEHPFLQVEDLLKVPGIGKKKFEAIKDKVYVQ
ncbi:MAG: helix-hairpin-helix domain-containing protein [Chlamydiae bacterium]|nr:helix-hairpin-helix domain-containing protein [Chlamydiota bacterium]MBI3277387.1 helix-hairpin-helix domain-containing protein [Chlamydiota bacterium]